MKECDVYGAFVRIVDLDRDGSDRDGGLIQSRNLSIDGYQNSSLIDAPVDMDTDIQRLRGTIRVRNPNHG
jgi:hypothetical protein